VADRSSPPCGGLGRLEELSPSHWEKEATPPWGPPNLVPLNKPVSIRFWINRHVLSDHHFSCVYLMFQLVNIIKKSKKITHILSIILHLHIKFQVQIHYILVVTKKEKILTDL
jgi:hypothetical protein